MCTVYEALSLFLFMFNTLIYCTVPCDNTLLNVLLNYSEDCIILIIINSLCGCVLYFLPTLLCVL